MVQRTGMVHGVQQLRHLKPRSSTDPFQLHSQDLPHSKESLPHQTVIIPQLHIVL